MKMIFKLLVWAIGFFLIWKVPKVKDYHKAAQSKHTMDDIGEQAPQRVSVIIPARNEEENLDRLLSSLMQQTVPPHEVLVINDGSDDHTLEVSRLHGARVITLEQPPEGWLGKNWACYTGAKLATGTHFLFLDADTWLEQDGLENIVECQRQNTGVVTITPNHVIHKPYENFSMFFNLMAGAGMRTFTMLRNKVPPAGLFGPSFYCSRDDYFTIDGHASVKASIVDDVDIGRNFVEAGIPLQGFGGIGTINVRMYPGGMQELIEGWTKNMGVGAKLTSPYLAGLIALWLTGALKAGIDFFTSLFSPRRSSLENALVYSAYVLQIRRMVKHVGGFQPWAVLLYPIPLVFASFIYFRSFVLYMKKSDVTWKGRSISTEDTAR